MEWLEPARCLLKQDTFPGICKFTDKYRCKELGARWRDGRWTALSKDTLLALCDSGLWVPEGFNHEANVIIVKLLRKEQTDREEADTKARMKRAGPTEEEKRVAKLKEFGIPPDEPKLLEELASKGINKEMTTGSGDLSCLGPRSGISNAARLLRGLRFNLVTVEGVVAGTAQEPSYSKTGKQGAKAGVSKSKGFDLRVGSQAKRARKKEEPQPPPQEQQVAQASRAHENYTDGQAPAKQVRRQFVDAEKCGDCGVVVERAWQFMECGCSGKMWKSCIVCLRPTPITLPSPLCAHCE